MMGKSHQDRQRAIEAVRRGKSRRDVAKQYKVSIHTIHAWMAQANAGTKLTAEFDFARAFERLEAKIDLIAQLIAGHKR